MSRGIDFRYQLSVLILAGVASIIVLGIARAEPLYDLRASGLFCAPFHSLTLATTQTDMCNGFPAAIWSPFQILRRILFYIPPFSLIGLLVWLGHTQLFAVDIDREKFRYGAISALAYFVGPVLLANMILKAWSGRPRPYESLPFGGDLTFVAAGDFSGACPQNCSFVSGEAAAAGWLLCLIPLINRRWRAPLSRIIIAISVATPVLRVVMGGHYLSDALLGWLLGVAAMPLIVVLAKLATSNRPAGSDNS